MIRDLLAAWCPIDWRAPLTAPAEDPLLELAAWEQQIRADERHRIIRQENTAVHGTPKRIGAYLGDRRSASCT